jgi:hypothetical protein
MKTTLIIDDKKYDFNFLYEKYNTANVFELENLVRIDQLNDLTQIELRRLKLKKEIQELVTKFKNW